MRIGILGGTFNPVHNGHIKLAAGAMRKLRLDSVIFVPAKIPPHKIIHDILPAKERYKMTSLAIKGLPRFKISDYEIKSRGTSYLVRTLKVFRKRFGKKAQIFFITGSDSLAQLKTWKHFDRIMELANFVVAKRPGYRIKAVKGVITISMPVVDISSSDIRQRIKKGLSVKKLIPGRVLKYINKKGFYR